MSSSFFEKLSFKYLEYLSAFLLFYFFNLLSIFKSFAERFLCKINFLILIFCLNLKKFIR
jgi:hypothetical protein